MRIAVFTNQFPGLVNTFFARDLRSLIDAGAHVEVFAIHPADDNFWVHVPELLSASILPRARVHHADLVSSVSGAMMSRHLWIQLRDVIAVVGAATPWGAIPLLKSAYVVPKALAWARLHRARFDHVLAYWGNYAATCAYLFHRACDGKLPFSMYLHAGTDLYRTRPFLIQKLDYADNIIVVCDFNRRFLRDTYPEAFKRFERRIYVHHLGVDLQELPFTLDGRASNRLLAVGGLHSTKGFDQLLRAAGELNRRGLGLEVDIVGDGPEGGALRQLAVREGIADCVRFLGWCSFEDVRAHMQRATLLVHPSAGLGDAVPTVIKEAMALGTPVVASDVAGIPELLDGGRCGELVPAGDSEALARAIQRLILDERRRGSNARLARDRAGDLFDLARNGAALADRLRNTLRHGSHATWDAAFAL
jgi:glycosyltransferase involved in cell wall biosynthesis